MSMISESNDLKKRSISSLAWKMVERGGNALVQMVVQVVMARLLTPSDFGALAIMLVFVNIGNVFVQSGLNTALIQADSVDQGSYSTVFWMSLSVSLVLYLMCFLGAPAIASFYAMPSIIWPLRVLCLLLIINAYNSVQIAKVTRDLEMAKTFISTVLSAVGSGVLGVGVALAGGGLWALVAQQLSYQFLNCVSLAFLVDWRPSGTFRSDEAAELFIFGSRLLASGLINTGYQSLSDLIVGTFSAESLGIMSQGKKYPTAVANILDGAVQPVMLSTMSHVSSDVSRARTVMRRALKSSCYLVMPMMTLLACVAPQLVPLLLGAQWAPSVPYFQVFCLTNALLPIHSTNLQALNAMGRSDVFLRLEIIKKIYGVAILLFCAFILKNVWLLCCSYLLTGVISTLVNAWPNKDVLNYGYLDQVRDLSPGILLSAVSSFAAVSVGVLPMAPIGKMALQVVVFIASYLGLSVVFRVESFWYLFNTARDLLVGKS